MEIPLKRMTGFYNVGRDHRAHVQRVFFKASFFHASGVRSSKAIHELLLLLRELCYSNLGNPVRICRDCFSETKTPVFFSPVRPRRIRFHTDKYREYIYIYFNTLVRVFLNSSSSRFNNMGCCMRCENSK